MNNVLKRTMLVIGNIIGVSIKDIHSHSTRDTLQLDSLDLTDIIMAVEEEFDMKLKNTTLNTVNQFKT